MNHVVSFSTPSCRGQNSVENGSFLDELPKGFLPYEEFVKQFPLDHTFTEPINLETKTLSQTMQVDVAAGIRMLWEADREVLRGFERFIPVIDSLAPHLHERMRKGGRVFLVGSGSSGRIGVDIAAKCAQISQNNGVIGVIAGGDSAIIRAKEGFEATESDGEKCLIPYDVKPLDTVFLISSSGSSFNVGCGHYAANRGAEVYYFYNRPEIQSSAKQLFTRTNQPVRPLYLEIGPQPIVGSTFQDASIAECAIGALIGSAVLRLVGKEEEAAVYSRDLFVKMREGHSLIGKHLKTIGQFAKKEAAILCSERSNCRRICDETQEGYVTFISDRNVIREVVADATEVADTFSMNPIRRESEHLQKRAEFRAYLAKETDNHEAWNALLGRPVEDRSETDQFLLASDAPGTHLYSKRPIGKGNFLIGVAKGDHVSGISKGILDSLQKAVLQGGDAGLIFLSKTPMTLPFSDRFLTLILQDIPSDRLRISETLLLKQVLNLISNSAMVLANRVYGNLIVDIRVSNHTIFRAIHLIKEAWVRSGRKMTWNDQQLYHLIAKIGVYSSSIVKVALAFLYLNKMPSEEGLQEAINFLAERNESLDFLSDRYTICIDGGGAKTVFQILNAKRKIVPLQKWGKTVDRIVVGDSNVSTATEGEVNRIFHDLFTEVTFGSEQQDIKNILPHARIVAGMAGVGNVENFQMITSLFEKYGVDKKNLLLMTDTEMRLHLLKGKGILLISGAGSICLTEKEGVQKRIGGLGRVLGNEGSSYQIGLQAIRAGLAEEFGYGPRTQLTEALRIFFGKSELKSLLPEINSLALSSAAIARSAPLVFEIAQANDPVAQAIISRAAEDLRELIATALKISKLEQCELHLWGGTFKNPFDKTITDQLKKEIETKQISIVNQSDQNAAVLYTRSI